MTVDEDGDEFVCQAGREADFGGRWLLSCHIPTSRHQHRVVSVLGDFIFCDTHMQELIAAGLITDPYISEDGARHLVKMELQGMRPRPLFGPWL